MLLKFMMTYTAEKYDLYCRIRMTYSPSELKFTKITAVTKHLGYSSLCSEGVKSEEKGSREVQ